MGSKIICGKWEDEFPKLADESVDLILTDPPYGLRQSVSNVPGDTRWCKSGESESRFTEALEGDDPKEYAAINWQEFFQQCYRVLKNDRYCVLHCQVPFVGQRWEDIKKSKLQYKGTIAWSKKFAIGGDLKGTAKRDWEPIVYLAKGKPSLNPLEVTRKGKLASRKRISEIEDWVFPLKKSEKRGHPTQKPQALAEQIVRWMCQRGQTVLDPFMGSGTTLMASELHGRVGVGIELIEEFCIIAEKRLKEISREEV